jgi:hypothetical protein
LVAVFSASILPSLAIEPVVSSTSATHILVLPHLTWDSAATFMVETPINPMKLALTSLEALTTTW